MKLESEISQAIRLAAPPQGVILWRNNVGALLNPQGVPIRFGLANDSRAINARLKSADLIGIKRLTVTADMVGSTIGQFVSVEVKAPTAAWRGADRVAAQQRWRDLVLSWGGVAVITDDERVVL